MEYNNAAGILADKNHFPGIDIVKFGESISIIQKRLTFEHISALSSYERHEVFRDYYKYEVIQGADRKKFEKNTGGCIQGSNCKCFDTQSVGCRSANQGVNV